MATWPTTLPAPQSTGYQVAPADQTVRSEMEVGLARSRRRTSARNDQIQVSWVLTDAQFATFRAWFDDEANGGASWFNGLSLAKGGGLTTPDCRFIGPFTASLIAANLLWDVSARLEVR